MTLDEFLEDLLNMGLEHYRKFYGTYRAEVTRVDDPEKRGRIQAVVPGALQREAPNVWIDPAFDGAGDDRGFFWPPEVGDSVRVGFERGDPRYPNIYWGGWYGAPAARQHSEVPTELGYTGTAPTKRGFVTRSGHRLVFDDSNGAEQVQLAWHQPSPTDVSKTDPTKTSDRTGGFNSTLTFQTDGSIELKGKGGATILMDAAGKNIKIQDEGGNSITVGPSGITAKTSQTIDLVSTLVNICSGADSPAVRGTELIQWLLSHTHPSPTGPTGPPMIPPPASILSRNVRLK